MKERREYFRFPAFARVTLRPVDAEEAEALRAHIRNRRVPSGLRAGALDESQMSPEARLGLSLLRYIAHTLERIERRLGERASGTQPDMWNASAPVDISLSACGFAGRFGLDIADKSLFEIDLDLGDAGLPPIRALAHAVADDGRLEQNAFEFVEIHPDDRERLVALALRTQQQALREERERSEG